MTKPREEEPNIQLFSRLFLFHADVKDVGMVAGAVVGILLAVIIVIITIWLVFRKKEKKKYEEEETPNEIRLVLMLCAASHFRKEIVIHHFVVLSEPRIPRSKFPRILCEKTVLTRFETMNHYT